MKRHLSAAALLAAFALGPAPAAAQTAGLAPPMLRLECGGVGLEESQRMRAEGRMHALMILFLAVDGSYLAGIDVRVDDPLGDQRVQASCGPIGLVDVPAAGRYRITATHGGDTREEWLELTPGGGASLTLRWME